MNTEIETGEIMTITEKMVGAIMIEMTLMKGIAMTTTNKNKSRLWRTRGGFFTDSNLKL